MPKALDWKKERKDEIVEAEAVVATVIDGIDAAAGDVAAVLSFGLVRLGFQSWLPLHED